MNLEYDSDEKKKYFTPNRCIIINISFYVIVSNMDIEIGGAIHRVYKTNYYIDLVWIDDELRCCLFVLNAAYLSNENAKIMLLSRRLTQKSVSFNNGCFLFANGSNECL